MRYAMPLLLIVCAGCSQAPAVTPKPDRPAPKYPTLAAGTAVMVSGVSSVLAEHPDGRKWERGEPEFANPFVGEGDRGIVLSDPNSGDDRETKVRMETGGKAGRSYLIERRHLAPLSTPQR